MVFCVGGMAGLRRTALAELKRLGVDIATAVLQPNTLDPWTPIIRARGNKPQCVVSVHFRGRSLPEALWRKLDVGREILRQEDLRLLFWVPFSSYAEIARHAPNLWAYRQDVVWLSGHKDWLAATAVDARLRTRVQPAPDFALASPPRSISEHIKHAWELNRKGETGQARHHLELALEGPDYRHFDLRNWFHVATAVFPPSQALRYLDEAAAEAGPFAKLREAVLSDAHPALIALLTELSPFHQFRRELPVLRAKVLQRLYRTSEAEASLQELKLPRSEVDAAPAMVNLASWFARKLGRIDQALLWNRRAIEHLGRTPRDVTDTWWHMEWSYVESNAAVVDDERLRPDEAIEHSYRCLAHRKLGRFTERYADVLKDISHELSERGDPSARALYAEAVAFRRTGDHSEPADSEAEGSPYRRLERAVSMMETDDVTQALLTEAHAAWMAEDPGHRSLRLYARWQVLRARRVAARGHHRIAVRHILKIAAELGGAGLRKTRLQVLVTALEIAVKDDVESVAEDVLSEALQSGLLVPEAAARRYLAGRADDRGMTTAATHHRKELALVLAAIERSRLPE